MSFAHWEASLLVPALNRKSFPRMVRSSNRVSPVVGALISLMFPMSISPLMSRLVASPKYRKLEDVSTNRRRFQLRMRWP